MYVYQILELIILILHIQVYHFMQEIMVIHIQVYYIIF